MSERVCLLVVGWILLKMLCVSWRSDVCMEMEVCFSSDRVDEAAMMAYVKLMKSTCHTLITVAPSTRT